MAQSQGVVSHGRPAAGGADLSSAADTTNLQRDVLQAFLEQMGGLKSSGPGIYVRLRA